ncbi:MAG TPA: hypothetical protein VMY34_02280, partial [Acidimicrobiales bacterium]|nr:hypothetical protein [Acidimicrobiales bacterium]
KVTNLRVRVLDQDAYSSDAGYSGHIFVDTDNYTLSGSVLSQDGSGGGFRETFGSGFTAQNRLGKWSFWGLSKTKTGSVSCASGTSIDVRILGLWIGVTGYLCP